MTTHSLGFHRFASGWNRCCRQLQHHLHAAGRSASESAPPASSGSRRKSFPPCTVPAWRPAPKSYPRSRRTRRSGSSHRRYLSKMKQQSRRERKKKKKDTFRSLGSSGQMGTPSGRSCSGRALCTHFYRFGSGWWFRWCEFRCWPPRGWPRRWGAGAAVPLSTVCPAPRRTV